MSYFPILVGDNYPMSRDTLYEMLKAHGIRGRRYFYPLISDFPVYRGLPSADKAKLRNAANASSRVICLPIYPALAEAEQNRIIHLIAAAHKTSP
jgi:dTDP-4-amino-4,6-dideoxygalactose transaminase